jgi:hypothetical protein
MRSLEVIINIKDGQTIKNGISFTNVDFTWPNGDPIPLSFGNLCNIGLKTLFRKRAVSNGPIRIIIKDVVNLDDPVLKINNVRGRRFYMQTEDKKAFFWLCNGIKTDLNFHIEKEEEAVLEWLKPPLEGEIKWFDLIAL